MFTSHLVRQAGVTLVEVLLVISMISVFAGFGIATVQDFLREKQFYYVADRARLIATILENNRNVTPVSYASFLPGGTLQELINYIGADDVDLYMPELLDGVSETDSMGFTPGTDYRITMTLYSVQVSWTIRNTNMHSFQVPFAVQHSRDEPAIPPDTQPVSVMDLSVVSSGYTSLTASYLQTQRVNRD